MHYNITINYNNDTYQATSFETTATQAIIDAISKIARSNDLWKCRKNMVVTDIVKVK